MRISDWSSDVSSSDLRAVLVIELGRDGHALLTQGIDDLFHRLLELPDLDGSIRRLANFRAACGYRDIRGNRIFSLGPPNHLPLGLLGPFVEGPADHPTLLEIPGDRKSTRLNSSH